MNRFTRHFGLVFAASMLLAGCFDSGDDDDGDDSSSSVESSSSVGSSSSSSTTTSSSSSVLGTEVGIDVTETEFLDTNVVYLWDGEVPTSDWTFGPGVNVRVLSNARIETKLTIKAGATFRFEEGGYLEFQENGTLDVQGTAADSVRFIQAVAGKNWGYGSSADFSGGLWFNSSAGTGSKITYLVIDGAKTAIYLDREDGLSITHSSVRNSKFHGIYIKALKGISENGLHNLELANNAVYDIQVDEATSLLRLDSSVQFSGAKPEVAIQASTGFLESGHLPVFTVPYLVLGRLTIGSTAASVELDIDAGTTFRFKEASYVEVEEGGIVRINGTASKPVTMNSADAGKYWGYGTSATFSGALWFRDNAGSPSVINHLVLDSATTGIYADGLGSITLQNSSLRNCKYYGMYLRHENALATGGLDSNYYQGNGIHNILTVPNNLADFAGTDSFAVDGKGVQIVGGDFSVSGTIQSMGVPYVVTGVIHLGNDVGLAKMTIEPGVEMQFREDNYLEVETGGNLVAVGTASDSIHFVSGTTGKKWGFGTSATYSGGLWFTSGAAGTNEIAYAVITDATSGIYVDDGAIVDVSNSSIRNNQFNGILVESAAQVTVAPSVVYAGNAANFTTR